MEELSKRTAKNKLLNLSEVEQNICVGSVLTIIKIQFAMTFVDYIYNNKQFIILCGYIPDLFHLQFLYIRNI